MSAEDILTKPPPPADERLSYGEDPSQFLEIRLPRDQAPYPGLLNIHGGFWRAKYDLSHAGHLCEAFRGSGIATVNVEYRRVGNPGGGWPGTFEDIRAAYRFIRQQASRLRLDLTRFLVIGHSAGGQLALCLASHEPTVRSVVSLAGVTDLKKGFNLHLSHDAVAEFLGGAPNDVPDHYREADPMEFRIPKTKQWLIHGTQDDTVPPEFSRDFVAKKKKAGETVELVEISTAGHFDLIDPASGAFKTVSRTVTQALSPKV